MAVLGFVPFSFGAHTPHFRSKYKILYESAVKKTN